MNVFIPEVRVGEPSVCGGVTVFPLFAGRHLFPDGNATLDYALAHEAMAAGMIAVREVSEAGSVGDLMVANTGDEPVLFLEGEELRGAKQNRILRSSVLVGGMTRTKIPVSCVERGRWRYDSPEFSSGSHCPPTLRHLLKGIAGGHGHGSSQTAIWTEIRRRHAAMGVPSVTENLSDTLDTHRGAVEDLRGSLQYAEGASGIAVAVSGKVVSIDLFDAPATLAKIWDRLAQGIALDALEVGNGNRQATDTSGSVRLYTDKMRSVTWHQADSVGLGERYHARDHGMLATALVMDSTLIHLSMSMPVVH